MHGLPQKSTTAFPILSEGGKRKKGSAKAFEKGIYCGSLKLKGIMEISLAAISSLRVLLYETGWTSLKNYFSVKYANSVVCRRI